MKVSLRSVSAGYGRGSTYQPVLKEICLDVHEGERVAILGVNGSGKTTLLRTMAGILPYEGEIRLDGRELKSMKRREISSCLSMMMQVQSTYFAYTVRETVMLGRYAAQPGFLGTASQKDRDTVEEILRQVELSHLAERPVNALSGGQLQRVFLARTLAQGTPIILLDEPANHLDLKIQAEIMEYLNVWAAREGHTLIGVYHDINMALGMAERLILMKDGQILKDGPAAQILSSGVLNTAFGMDIPEYMKKQYAVWKNCDTIKTN